MPIDVDMPLSDDELDLLEERGLDVHHALGVIHAVGVAPGMIPTPQWLPLAFGNVPPDQTTIGLVLRLYNEAEGSAGGIEMTTRMVPSERATSAVPVAIA